MFEMTGEAAFLEEAFLIAEKNKGILLYEKFLEHQARNAPAYQNHRLKPKKDPVSLSEIRAALLKTSDQTLIEYFIGTQRAYAFRLSRSTLEIFELVNREVLDSLVRALRTSISKPWEAEIRCATHSNIKGAFCQNLDSLKTVSQTNYIRYATDLYQCLIAPLENGNSPLSNNLIVVPDAFLSLLPFDALLTKVPDNPDEYRTHPYLLHRYQMSYGPSASLLAGLASPVSTPKAERAILVMAPFNEKALRYQKLPHSQQEAKSLYKNWGGMLLLGEHADTAAFHRFAPGSKILHISSHAFGKKGKELKTRIAFADQDLFLGFDTKST
jgi:CHAT domain-containing protein